MTSLWTAWKLELACRRESEEISNLIEDYEALLELHYYTDDCDCLVCDESVCGLCGKPLDRSNHRACYYTDCPWGIAREPTKAEAVYELGYDYYPGS